MYACACMCGVETSKWVYEGEVRSDCGHGAARAYVCVCEREGKRGKAREREIRFVIYMCMCVCYLYVYACVCVCGVETSRWVYECEVRSDCRHGADRAYVCVCV